MAISIQSHSSTSDSSAQVPQRYRVIQALKVSPDSAFRKMDREIQSYVTHNGLELFPGERPDTYQVTHCTEWIKRFARPRKSINYSISSYGLKHIVEVWTFEGATWPDPRGYVTNGSFIEAALNLDYKYLPAGSGRNPNCFFDMAFKRDRKHVERIYGRETFLPWDEPTEETHVLEYSRRHHERGLFPFHVSSKAVSDRRGCGPGKWRVIASGTSAEMFAALETKAKEMGVS